MLAKPALKYLIKKYLLDAKALVANRRYSAAIYLAGYSVELKLKYRICQTMALSREFPETKVEFDSYFLDVKKKLLRRAIKELRDIRHHNLSILLQHSGNEFDIEAKFLFEWNLIKVWKPEMRYKIILRKSKCSEFLNSIEIVVQNIMSNFVL